MPIILPQLSRREFLKRAALTGAAAALAPSLFAELAAKPRDLDMVFFLSDTHIAADAATISHGVNMTSNLSAVVREVLAWPVAPATIIVNGDQAFKLGLPRDYAAFGKLFEPLRALAPVHLTLGNHDQRENFWQAFPLDATKSESVPQKQVAIFSGARANWFLLDSLEVTDIFPGRLGPAPGETAAGLRHVRRALRALRCGVAGLADRRQASRRRTAGRTPRGAGRTRGLPPMAAVPPRPPAGAGVKRDRPDHRRAGRLCLRRIRFVALAGPHRAGDEGWRAA